MKIVLILIFVCMGKVAFPQNSDSDLNGKIFRGTAIEEVIEGVYGSQRTYEEIIEFTNGKVYSNVLNEYSANGIDYTSEVDDRRMIAVKVINYNSGTTVIINGKQVKLEFTGAVLGDKNLSGNLIIKYPDNSEIKYSINAQSIE